MSTKLAFFVGAGVGAVACPSGKPVQLALPLATCTLSQCLQSCSYVLVRGAILLGPLLQSRWKRPISTPLQGPALKNAMCQSLHRCSPGCHSSETLNGSVDVCSHRQIDGDPPYALHAYVDCSSHITMPDLSGAGDVVTTSEGPMTIRKPVSIQTCIQNRDSSQCWPQPQIETESRAGQALCQDLKEDQECSWPGARDNCKRLSLQERGST